MDAADTVMNRVKPIAFAGVETLSFRQLDELNGLGKGSSFKLFKTLSVQNSVYSNFFLAPFEGMW